MTTLSLPSRPASGDGDTDDPVRPPWLVEHRPFLIALAAGALLRVVVMVAFTPAFIHSDGPTYLYVTDPVQPIADRPAGYSIILLNALTAITEDVTLVTAVQHVFGLLTAVILYALLRQWGVGRRVATLAALPVLLDAMQLQLEHSIHSDSLFVLLVTGGLALVVWRRRLPLLHALAGGALLGTSMTVRQLGGALVVAAVIAALTLGGPWWRRALTAAVVMVGFVAAPVAYATWYQQERGLFALSEGGDQALYARVTTFVDCSQVTVADYQRVLCPVEDVGLRHDPSYYAFDDPRTVPSLELPPGVTDEAAMGEFARAVIRAQPLDYARTVARDALLNFDYYRVNRFEYRTAHKWRFGQYVAVGTPYEADWAYARYGGPLQVRQPWADALAAYQVVGYLPGPVLLGCIGLGAAAVLGRGRFRDSGLRSVTAVLLLGGGALMVAPAFTAQFVWRYQLPAVVLLPAAAALAWTAMRRDPAPEAVEETDPQPAAEPDAEPDAEPAGTRATASTD